MGRIAIRTAALAAVLSIAPLASATVYNSVATFLPNVQAGYYLNAFNDAAPGPAAPMNYGPVGGFAYTVDTIGPGNSAPNSGLYNDTGVISTDNANDLILVTFTGAPVTAIGGNFWSTDITVTPLPAMITIELSNGDVESFLSSSATDFRGFTTSVGIASITIDADDSQEFVWSTMDNLYVGTANVPAPASAALLGVGGLVALRRRR
jgi:MYXO-CTERM domain-containing protein